MNIRDLVLTLLAFGIIYGCLSGAVYSCMTIAGGGSLLWLILAIPCSLILGLITIGFANNSLSTIRHKNTPNDEVKK